MRIIFGVIFMLSLYAGSNFYIAFKLYKWLNLLFQNINIKIFICIYIFFALSIIFNFLSIPPVIKRVMSWISAYWMGIFAYLLIFFLLADLVVLFGSLIKIIPVPVALNIRFFSGLFAILLTAGFVSYGIFNANQIINVSYNINLKNKELSSGLKITLVSDLHLGAVNSEKNLERVIKEINNAKPDLVCIAGDIFNDNFNAIHNPLRAMDLFKSITSRYGVYACLGNHDGGKTYNEMTRFLNQSNIMLLNDDYAIIDEKLILIGRVDPSPIGGFHGLKRKKLADITSLINKDAKMPIVVMDHNPSNIDQYGSDFDLIISGHTHRGQIFPGRLLTNAMFAVDYGYYKKNDDNPHIVVTSGAGTWGMPMRIGTNSEIVHINLR